jgi:hypothetical protein
VLRREENARTRHSVALAALCAALAQTPALAHEGHGHEEGAAPAEAAAPAPLPHAFAQLAALVGVWVAAADGPAFRRGELVSRFELTGGGSALIERLSPGQAHEMTTLYRRDGADLVLAHYCASGNQPRMRATAPAADARVLDFAFEGGSNLDAARDSHMHSARLELRGPDELVGEWQGWDGGRPSDPPTRFHLLRRR